MNMKKIHTLDLQGLDNNISDRDKLIIKKYYQEDFEGHDHKFFELVYVMEGTALHTLNGLQTTVKKGDYFIVDLGSVHSYTESKNLTLINCLFLPEIIDETLKGSYSFDELMHGCLLRYNKLYLGQTSANRIFHDGDLSILALLQGMMKEYEEKQVGYNDVFRCRLLEILIKTMRNIVKNEQAKSKSTSIYDAIQFIHANYPSKNILEQYSKEYHFTSQYISRRFKAETGYTFSKYLQKVRIEKACELLASTDQTIVDIAEKVGYYDIKYFNDLFKRMLKMTPSEYRKLA